MIEARTIPAAAVSAASVISDAGEHSYRVFHVSMRMHQLARASLVARFQGEEVPAKALLLFRGGQESCRHETDHEDLFRQESTFQYLFGVKEADCFATIEAKTGFTTLYIPRLPEAYAIWMGEIKTTDQFKAEYEVDAVQYVEDLAATIQAYGPETIYVSKGQNTDSGSFSVPAHVEGLAGVNIDDSRLYDDVALCRMIKNEEELKLMRFVNEASSEAHFQMMRRVRPGMMEYQLEALYIGHAYYFGGCRLLSYTPISGSGKNSATLHYGHAGAPNNKLIQDGDMILADMGAELHCYASDITNSFPANGRFAEDQRLIFETVAAMQHAVLDAMRPGVQWLDMHALAYRVMCERLLAAGLFRGDVETLLAANVPAVFMPHGLGHFLGIDTHDVAGYPRGVERDTRTGYKSVRCGRALEPGMVITVEPGVYFIDHCLVKAIADPELSQHLNLDVLARFRNFGGVRLEDNVIVTETGIENMTTAPRSVAAVEGVMQGTISTLEELKAHK